VASEGDAGNHGVAQARAGNFGQHRIDATVSGLEKHEPSQKEVSPDENFSISAAAAERIDSNKLRCRA
jgi:hypothetical protein